MKTEMPRQSARQALGKTFGALIRHPNYRLYWFGALTSNIGTWIQMVAQGWLVYQLTGSALDLGIVGFATALPILFLSLFGGVLADRFERRRLMVYTQTGSMLLAFLLSYLTLAGHVTVPQIVVIAFLNGIVNSLNAPVRQSIISDLVDREDLMNAIALNSAQFQMSRFFGPALAGAIVAAVGSGWCFFINGVSFLAVIAALLAMQVPPLPAGRRNKSVWKNLTEGIRYVRAEPTLVALLGLAIVPALFAMPFQQLMPVFAQSVLNVGAQGLGLLMSASGLGALIGALGVASLGKNAPRGKLMLAAVTLFGTCLVIFALSRTFWLSLVVLVGVGIASMSYNALNQTFIQTLAADEMRGRVMSLLTLTTFGIQPFGSLQAGAVAQQYGANVSVFIGGLICACFAVWLYAARPRIRELA